MNLDRVLIKKQANQLVKGRATMLFLITFIVAILCNASSVASAIYDTINGDTLSNILSGDFFDFDLGDDEDSSSNSFDKGYFDDFNGSVTLTSYSKNFNSINIDKESLATFAINIFAIFMLPLMVSIWGIYLCLIRGQLSISTSFFGYVFKNAFDKKYWTKLWCVFIQHIIITLMSFLLIVPGIIFYYRYYFANAIMADNPNITASQAIDISKKITANHKSELFALDLSFIGWFILTILTCGILSIYTLPYYATTKALYYENFRLRAMQEGRINGFDFMTNEEKMNYYYYQTQNQNNQQQYYQPKNNNSQNFGSGENNDYYNNNF